MEAHFEPCQALLREAGERKWVLKPSWLGPSGGLLHHNLTNEAGAALGKRVERSGEATK